MVAVTKVGPLCNGKEKKLYKVCCLYTRKDLNISVNQYFHAICNVSHWDSLTLQSTNFDYQDPNKVILLKSNVTY